MLNRPKTKVRLVGKLRYLCRKDQFPDKSRQLLEMADRLLMTITAMGLEFAPLERIELTGAYEDAARLVKSVTGETWPGEARSSQP